MEQFDPAWQHQSVSTACGLRPSSPSLQNRGSQVRALPLLPIFQVLSELSDETRYAGVTLGVTANARAWRERPTRNNSLPATRRGMARHPRSTSAAERAVLGARRRPLSAPARGAAAALTAAPRPRRYAGVRGHGALISGEIDARRDVRRDPIVEWLFGVKPIAGWAFPREGCVMAPRAR